MEGTYTLTVYICLELTDWILNSDFKLFKSSRNPSFCILKSWLSICHKVFWGKQALKVNHLKHYVIKSTRNNFKFIGRNENDKMALFVFLFTLESMRLYNAKNWINTNHLTKDKFLFFIRQRARFQAVLSVRVLCNYVRDGITLLSYTQFCLVSLCK